MKKKRVYIDMDNVLVNFQSGIDRLSEETQKKYAGRLDEVPGIFSLMEPMEGAIDAIHQLQPHFDLYILSTAPWKNPSAWSDKVKWVTKYLDDVFHKRMIITHCKNLCKGDYLIDDRGKNGTSEFEGEWIEFGSEKYPSWKEIVEYLLPTKQNMIAKALDIAYNSHKGQVDKGGNPYILHPIRVALHCQNEDEKIVALLHDVVEDTDVTIENLRIEGFDQHILDAIEALTKVEGENYEQFIQRVAQNDLATRVKIQDLKDNMDTSRIGGKPHWKKDTYTNALSYLEKVINKDK